MALNVLVQDWTIAQIRLKGLIIPWLQVRILLSPVDSQADELLGMQCFARNCSGVMVSSEVAIFISGCFSKSLEMAGDGPTSLRLANTLTKLGLTSRPKLRQV